MDWQAVTRIGDASVMLPVAAVVAVGLGLARSWRATGLWLVLVGTGLGVIVASKLAFLGWGIGSRALDFTGVSGHTLLATLVSAGAALAVLPGKAPAGDRLGVVAGAVTGAVIAASRLALHVHSISEVVSRSFSSGSGRPGRVRVRSGGLRWRPPSRCSSRPDTATRRRRSG